MSARPSAPGLSVVYHAERVSQQRQVRYFGPYLGGLRVRQAAAALHRILPLSYTKARLAGAERDMARHRGVVSDDRGQLISELTAILNREPAAVSWAREELGRLRDRATAELAYELAAQVHREIAAVDWVTSAQRVTTMDNVSQTASGWSGGTLVQFQIRGGRVRAWTQRACTRSRAERALEVTPPDWREFMLHNAELAARLAQHES
jgi:excinuclease ABC subunit C